MPKQAVTWVLRLTVALGGLTVLLPVVDGDNKTLANIGVQLLANGTFLAAGAGVALLVGNRPWAPRLLAPLFVGLSLGAALIWHLMPIIDE